MAHARYLINYTGVNEQMLKDNKIEIRDADSGLVDDDEREVSQHLLEERSIMLVDELSFQQGRIVHTEALEVRLNDEFRVSI